MMTTAIRVLVHLARPGSNAIVPAWLWDRAISDIFRAPPSDEVQAAFMSITLSGAKRAR